jgi:predicted site-specific integrase-resolvase
MLIGYARVSTQDQTLNLQKDALEKLGCNKIFTDTASGAKAERNGLEEALEYVREGDTLVVWRLDRLGRSSPVPYERPYQAASCRGFLTPIGSLNKVRIISNARRKAPLVSSLSGTRLNS